MLLDRIDIDAHGPLHRIELGPFSEHLNVVWTPRGAGKTAIARFLRDTLVDRHYPVGMLSSSTGRVVWADRDGMLHCYREQDGTRQGRRRVHFEPRGDRQHFDRIENDWLGTIDHDRIGRPQESEPPQVPEAVADGIMTDTALTSVARVISACLRSGIDCSQNYRPLPMVDEEHDPQVEANHRRWRSELADIDSELARSIEQQTSYEALLQRREELTWKMVHDQSSRHVPAVPESVTIDTGYESWRGRLTHLYDRARELRSRQSQLRRWIEDAERSAGPDFSFTSPAGPRASSRVRNEWRRRKDELHRVTEELNQCLSEAASVRQASWSTCQAAPETAKTNLLEELRRIDDQLASLSRIQWLKTRRDRLRSALHGTVPMQRSKHPLAVAASAWLVRLTGGRLNHLAWSDRLSGSKDASHNGAPHRTGVMIDQRDEAEYSRADRAVAVIAVRLAAGELLARTGRHLPLVLEIHAELMLTPEPNADRSAYQQSGTGLRRNHSLATALRDYASAGRQLLILTSDRLLADELQRVDARCFEVVHQRTVHAHRPVWRSHHETETYVGPHYDPAQVDSFTGIDSVNGTSSLDVAASRNGTATHRHTATHVPNDRTSAASNLGDINRDFDIAWQQTESVGATSRRRRRVITDMLDQTDAAIDGTRYRDGYHYSDQFTTHPTASTAPASANRTNRSQLNGESGTSMSISKPRSPYLLSVDSPIDQAPSIDAVAAARLRRLDVTHVTHLMQQDSNRLADALGLADVDAATVRRWKAESRLCCQVPHLRNFDARILVGCGITKPAQLSATHPADLLEDVEKFLVTDEGTRILSSGTSHELARLTTWIATANRSTGRIARSASQATRRSSERSQRDSQFADVDVQSSQARSRDRHPARRNRRTRSSDRDRRSELTGRREPTDRRELTGRRGIEAREEFAAFPQPSDNRREPAEDQVRRQSNEKVAVVAHRPPQDSTDQSRPQSDVVAYVSEQESEWRFYLDRSSPVVDAPTIGSRMAERLADLEILTVDDLLNADAEEVAEQLNHRRTDAETVVQWQQQATLVCRVPMLRGHDAQLLVAAGVTTAEELATCEAKSLCELIDEVAQSSLGRRIIRGGQDPDLEEVSGWIQFAQHTRELKAA